MEPYGNVPPEEFASWLTPTQALDAVNPRDRLLACVELLRRLKVGRARAAGDIVWRNDGKTQTNHARRIPPEWWNGGIEYIGSLSHPLWSSGGGGGVTFKVRTNPAASARVQECFDLKFDPVGLVAGATAPAASTPAAGRSPASALRTATKDDPPISRKTLAAWWDMCLTIKAAVAWTDPEIRDFYDRCFPDKFASRNRLRDLRKGQVVPGPKAKAAE